MADNVAITEGSGTNIAADDVGGVKYQRVKMCYGTDGNATDASATNPLPVMIVDTSPETSNFEKLTVSDTAKVLTSATYGTATKAVVTVETNSIRFRTDGTAPDASTGHLVTAGNSIEIDTAADIANFKAIRVTSDATIQVSYFGG